MYYYAIITNILGRSTINNIKRKKDLFIVELERGDGRKRKILLSADERARRREEEDKG